MATTAAATPSNSAGVGIIYPPPEVRNIVDKTAAFVAKNGLDFAERIRKEKEGEVKFNFLNPGNPYHVYFQHKVTEFKEGKSELTAPTNKTTTEEPKSINEALDLDRIALSDPPPDPEFISDAPPIAAQDLDIVKLTAQFVAKNGRQFLISLIQREQGNYQFDFLRPQHSLFHYFSSLVDQYTKIFYLKKEVKEQLGKDNAEPFNILKRVNYAMEWEKRQQRRKQQAADEAEAERTSFAQIDWHDFLVVETLNFNEDEADLPAPIKPEDLGARLIEMEHFERQQKEKERERQQPTGQDNTMDVEMDMDEPQNEEPVKPQEPPPAPAPAPSSAPTPVPAPAPQAPPPAPAGEVKIRQYDPKAKHSSKPSADKYLVSPLTGEQVLASKMAEHLRIGLLDPKWREQKDRLEAEMAKNKEAWQLGADAAFNNLKEIASRRTDIFGSGDKETAIGFKMGEEETRPDETLTWDGHAHDTGVVARLAQAAQVAHTKPPPTSTAAPAPAPAPFPKPPVVISNPHPVPPMPRPAAPVMHAFPPGIGLQAPAPHMPPPRPMPPPPQYPPMPSAPLGLPPGFRAPGSQPGPPGVFGMHGGPPGVPSMPMPMSMRPPQMMAPIMHIGREAPGEEPSAKRAKTGIEQRLDQLQGEEAFIARHPHPVSISVTAPVDEKFNLHGQTVRFEFRVTDKVSDIKNKIQEALAMPSGKQKLQIGELVLNNDKSLAFYNLGANGSVQLSEKKRGGK